MAHKNTHHSHKRRHPQSHRSTTSSFKPNRRGHESEEKMRFRSPPKRGIPSTPFLELLRRFLRKMLIYRRLLLLIGLILVIICLLLRGTSFDGGRGTAALPLSEQVIAYRPYLESYAREYNMIEYEPLLEATMMQESEGEGTDPMQSSECSYNTEYANAPNSIDDPVYSIEIGVREMADCLSQAEVRNPHDYKRIRLALQGYNFGPDYIPWALEQNGGYTASNAEQFSEMKKQALQTDVYGDPQYPMHVMRYYATPDQIAAK